MIYNITICNVTNKLFSEDFSPKICIFIFIYIDYYNIIIKHFTHIIYVRHYYITYGLYIYIYNNNLIKITTLKVTLKSKKMYIIN